MEAQATFAQRAFRAGTVAVFTLIYSWGVLTGNLYPEPPRTSETRFFFEALAIIVVREWFLYRQRDAFGVDTGRSLSPVSSAQ